MDMVMTELATADRRANLRPGSPFGAIRDDRPAAEAGTVAGRLDRFAEIILRRGLGAEAVLEVAAEAPDCPRAQACAAVFHWLSDTRSGIEAARIHLRRAARHLPVAGGREERLVRALCAIGADRPATAAGLFHDQCRSFPDDLFAAYLAQLHFLNYGLFEDMLALAEFVHQANPQNGFALAMLSFALEQSARFGEAEEYGLEACSRDPHIPWAHHAVAHVYLSQGRTGDGLRFLNGHAESWRSCGSSMFTHNWWHLMLFSLARAETGHVLSLYDSQIAPHAPLSVSSYVNAASMLARLEIHGVDVGGRWQPLAGMAEGRIGEHVLAFTDLHFALALGRAGRFRALAELRGSARHCAARATSETARAWGEAGLPLMEGISAYCKGDWSEAVSLFAHANPQSWLIGGSRAQRQLFRDLEADARECRAAAGKG